MKEFLQKYIALTEDMDIEVSNSPVTGKRILKVLSLISMVCFFFPLCIVSCSGEKVKVNGIKSSFGFEFYNDKIDGNLLCLLLLLIPTTIFATMYIRNLKKNKMMTLFYLVGSIIVIVILSKYKTRITDLAYSNGAEVKFGFAYHVSILSAWLILITSTIMSLRIHMKTIINKMPILSSLKINSVPKKVCNECHNLVLDSAVFCPNCGTKLVEVPQNSFCATCGAQVDDKMKFCSGCGSQIQKIM